MRKEGETEVEEGKIILYLIARKSSWKSWDLSLLLKKVENYKEAKRGRGMKKSVKTLKGYSINEQVLYTTILKHSYRPAEDRTRLQRTLTASLRIWQNSLILATPSVFSKPASGCSGILLEMQIFCPTPDLLIQILHFSKIPKSCANTLKFEKHYSGRGEPPL